MRVALGLSFAAVLLVAASCGDQQNAGFSPPESAEGGSSGGEGGVAEGGGSDGSTVVGDPSKGILLEGTVIGETGPYEGQVLTLPDGTIGCAAPGKACEADPLAAGVAHAFVDGVIAPGLIDTHNHILFDIFDDSDWLPQHTYTNHNDWTKDTNEPRYTVMVDVKQCLENASMGKPTWCPPKYATAPLKCEMEKWGELKALAAGTTSVVALPGTASPCYATLARTIDTQFNGFGTDKVQTAAIFPSKTAGDGVCANYTSGKTDAYLIHIGEGIDQTARDEFTKMGSLTTTANCLYAPQTAITHGTSFTPTEFAAMKAKDMKLTWSPASNIALYGATTNIPQALDAGLLVSLAPDWSMGGSQNLLDELRFAKKYSDTNWAGRLTAQDLVAMVTTNAATIVALGDKLGTLKKGMQADVMVVRGPRATPYDAVVGASAKDVILTMVAGKVLYGDVDLRAIAAAGSACEDFDSCGTPKFLCAADPSQTANKLNQTYAEIHGVLEAAMADMDTVRPAGIGGNFAPVAPVVGCTVK